MITQIKRLPVTPSRARPAQFSDESNAFLGALPDFGDEANQLATEVNDIASQVEITAGNVQSSLNAATNNAVAQATASASASADSAQNSANSANQSAILADVSEKLAEQFANAAQGVANYRGDWSADRTYAKGQTVSYDKYLYVSRVDSNLNQIPSVATNSWFEIKTESDLFRQPVAISPVTGDSGVLINTSLSATPFAALYSIDTRISRRFEVALLSDPAFSSPIFTANVDSDSVSISTNLELESAYTWRCKDIATTGESAWMQANSFTTGNVSIVAPTVTVTGTPTSVPETPTITATAFTTIPAGQDTHFSTDWEVRKVSDNSLVWSSYNNTVDKTTITVPAGVLLVSTEYVFKVRYNGDTFGSSVYGSASGTTVASYFDTAGDIDNLTTLVTIQQEYNPATTYSVGQNVIVRFGDTRFVEYKSLTSGNLGNNPVSSPSHWEIIYDNSISTSGYFGEVLGNKCVVDKGEWDSTTTYAIGDMVVVANNTPPLTQADLTAYVSKTANNLNKSPASYPADWEQRNGLPTGTSLAQTLGIGNVTPEVLINNNSGWLKFVHNGKIKYIAKKPFMHTVCWDDIAKAEAVYGNRTVRIGSRLFRVSLLSGAEADPSSWIISSTASDNKGAGSEWNELVYRVHNDVPTDGATTSQGGKQVGLNWWNFTNADIVVGSGNGRYTWCKETLTYDSAKRVLRGLDSLSYFGYTPSASTTPAYGWRPCLTLISDEELEGSLYKAPATGVGPSVASLQYDPITDTGYYGEVTSAQFYTGTQISTATGVTSGTLQNDTEGWLKFYWHGQVLFIAKKTYRYSISWNNINSANAVYGVNLGSTGKKTITHSGSSTKYDVKLMKGAVKDPSPGSGGGGRQWNELLYRVCTGTETGQIGANWANLAPAALGSLANSNGTITGCQEVLQSTPVNRVIRGSGAIDYFSEIESHNTSNFTGWRPCLALSV